MKQITGTDILAALEAANEEVHPAQQAYVDGYGPPKDTSDLVLDGHFNLNRVAEILNERLVA